LNFGLLVVGCRPERVYVPPKLRPVGVFSGPTGANCPARAQTNQRGPATGHSPRSPITGHTRPGGVDTGGKANGHHSTGTNGPNSNLGPRFPGTNGNPSRRRW